MFLQRAAVLIELVKGIERLMSIHWRKIEQPRDFNVTLAEMIHWDSNWTLPHCSVDIGLKVDRMSAADTIHFTIKIFSCARRSERSRKWLGTKLRRSVSRTQLTTLHGRAGLS